MRLLLGFMLAILAAADALACSCAGQSLKHEARYATMVFVGRAVDLHLPERGEWLTRTTFEVYQSWKPHTPRFVTVVSGGSCEYVPDPDRMHLIFAYRRDLDGPQLWADYCSHNAPLLCSGENLRRLGRPGIRYRPLPFVEVDQRLSGTNGCTRPPIAPAGDDLHLPPGTALKHFAATILRDGSVSDLRFELDCGPARCTRALKARVRAAIESRRYQPATLGGRPVALRIAD